MKLFNMYYFQKYELLKTSSVDGLRRGSKALSKATLARKTCHGKCLVVCCPHWPSTAFWTSMSEEYAQQINEMQWRLQGLQPALVHRKGPVSSMTAHHTTNTSKVSQIGLWCFASSTTFTWLLANQLPLVQASWWVFAGKALPQPAGCKKSCPRVHHIPKHGFFFATGINKLISHWQKCVDSNGSYFD